MERILLENTHFEGENDVYLFAGDRPALVDAGIATERTRDRLERELADHSVGFEDIETLVLTHYHSDHSGLAGAIQRAGGATVYVHHEDAPLVAGDEDAWGDYRATHDRLLDEWGVPTDKQDELRKYMFEGEDTYSDSVDVTLLEEGDRVPVNETELEVVHTPGHSRGSCSFVMADRNEVLTGDALLPEYTPNVGGADVRVDRPLERYLDTLGWLADAGFDRAWPGHRDPIADPAARATEIVKHHEQRAYRILDALRAGPMDPWDVSADLFGELDGIHILHGPGEAYAHLEHLERAGEVVRTDATYRITPDARERLDRREAGSWDL